MFKRWWWVFLVSAMIGPVLGFAVAAVVTYVMPKKYESEVTVEVMPRDAEMSSPSADSKPVSPQFFGTEFEKIKRSDSLGKVVDHLELVNRWMVDKETAVRILKGIVSTQNIRGTDLISIRVRHTNKMDARDIADELGKSYMASRYEIENHDVLRAHGELVKAVRDQEDKVVELQRVCRTTGETLDSRGKGSKEPTDPAESDVCSRFSDDEMKLLNQELNDKLKNARDQLKRTQGELSLIEKKQPFVSYGVDLAVGPVGSSSPVSPNVTLNLVLGTVLGLLVSPLFALPLMVVLNRLFPAKTSG